MNKKLKFEWENIFEHIDDVMGDFCERTKVIGGWLVRTSSISTDEEGDPRLIAETLVFVPDPNHEWEIDNDLEIELRAAECKYGDHEMIKQIFKDNE